MNNNLKSCFESNVENPYMNFLSGGSSQYKSEACPNQNSREKFYQGSSFRPADIKYNESFTRNHFTNTVTTAANNQTVVAKYLYPDTAKCRNDNYSCKINTNISKNKQRTVVQSNYYKPNYLDIFGVYNSYK